MLPGETIRSAFKPVCTDCREPLVVCVLRSAAGHYLGTACLCGPHSRETGYFASREEADLALGAFNAGDDAAARVRW